MYKYFIIIAVLVIVAFFLFKFLKKTTCFAGSNFKIYDLTKLMKLDTNKLKFKFLNIPTLEPTILFAIKGIEHTIIIYTENDKIHYRIDTKDHVINNVVNNSIYDIDIFGTFFSEDKKIQLIAGGFPPSLNNNLNGKILKNFTGCLENISFNDVNLD